MMDSGWFVPESCLLAVSRDEIDHVVLKRNWEGQDSELIVEITTTTGKKICTMIAEGNVPRFREELRACLGCVPAKRAKRAEPKYLRPPEKTGFGTNARTFTFGARAGDDGTAEGELFGVNNQAPKDSSDQLSHL